jgi:hypothetical protein
VKLRTLQLWLLAIALAIRFLAPPGFMVGAADAAGLPTIVICTSNGFKQIAIGPDGQPVEHQAPSAGEPPCSFAFPASVLIPPDQSQPFLSARWTSADLVETRSLASGSHAGHAWRARAPPSHQNLA